jgi:hypothetical protein
MYWVQASYLINPFSAEAYCNPVLSYFKLKKESLENNSEK